MKIILYKCSPILLKNQVDIVTPLGDSRLEAVNICIWCLTVADFFTNYTSA